MASQQPVTQPLRISKNALSPSPSKSGLPRPLSEIRPTEHRRNSPSFNQSPTKKMTLNTDSSPFQSSPLDSTTSPRLFWQKRNSNNTENDLYGGRSGSPSPTRRTSIERLQKASRVKNSTMFAREQKQEYDPARVPQVERPLAKVQGNAYGGTGVAGMRSAHARSESQTNIPLYSPTKSAAATPTSESFPRSPSKNQASPTKSSLSSSRFKSSYDSESANDSFESRELPDGKALHRHAKSVTFDAAPPQVNEYEMATPDLSSIGTNSREGSYESGEEDYDEYGCYDHDDQNGHEDSFDASLEDTDKTPVVGPDDWRRESPVAHREYSQGEQFESSPMPEQPPSQASAARPQPGRSDSSNSNGDHRPLPPLPPQQQADSPSSKGLSITADRMLGGSHRSLPSPPPASASKSDIQNIGNAKMTLEERLKLMMLSDETSPKAAEKSPSKTFAEQQRERRMRRAGARDRVASPTPEREVADEAAGEEDDTIGDLSGLDLDYQLPSISRQSILRRVNGNKAFDRDSDYNFNSSPAPGSSPERQISYDPDVPIASIEDSILEEDEIEGSVIINPDAAQEEDEVGDITDLYQHSEVENDDTDSVVKAYDSDSHYSDEPQKGLQQVPIKEDMVLTPRAASPAAGEPPTNFSATLPRVNSTNAKDTEFTRSLQSYMLPKPREAVSAAYQTSELERPRTPQQTLPNPDYDGSGWGEPDEEEEEPGTPESVIHHPVSDDDEEPEFAEPIEQPAVPEQIATIKASGSKLKTRASATPSDLQAMREARRQVSREVAPIVPPIPERHRNRISRDFDAEEEATGDDFLDRHPSFKKRSLTLDLDLGLSLDQDFERVIEAQKRGYLMRQNTKLVVASSRDKEDAVEDRLGTRSAGNSPVKQTRPQSWTVEPWNGKMRQRSLRKRGAGPSMNGPVPPMPGQESNAVALNSLAEESAQVEAADADSGERGRLFVKVMGVKDLDLPLPKNERTWFALTLDNGVHCVTTAWLELARNAPIGQEFELVVPNDLEFQLTLNVKLEQPAPQRLPMSPSKKSYSKPKTSTFSRVFASPKKRKELEARMKADEEAFHAAQREEAARKMNVAPTAWDLLSPLAAEDGSFARSYVCLKEHETRCYGRPALVEVACFNEWATEEPNFASSVKSKRGNALGNSQNQVVRRAPYKIGKLEVQLLFVPRPKNSTDDDMPKSMNSCIRELKAAEERLSRCWEGHLSQQGGDCPYWRRRYFKLAGTKLTAYHEATRQPRATINLSNTRRLIDDRRALTNAEPNTNYGSASPGKSKRRRSAFAEEEEGYMFVEEGFRIRFNNGEVIDFYADTAEDKAGWMKVLGDVIGRGSGEEEDGPARRKWCELVLKREEAMRKRAEGRRVHSRTKSTYN